MSQGTDFFDIRHLRNDIKKGDSNCYVKNCTSEIQTAPSQWGEMPFCPVHKIRIHPSTNTFVYYNGTDPTSKKQAALRNIQFNKKFFSDCIIGNAYKAESHRICHETSEDAVTWNVFSELLRTSRLGKVLKTLTGIESEKVRLILWGLEVDLKGNSMHEFKPLNSAREVFESDIRQFLTEPDIMLYVKDIALVLIEAKFTSGNTIARQNGSESPGEKPSTKQGIISRYSYRSHPGDSVYPEKCQGPFYSQLYRNLIFAIHMANSLGVKWHLCNLLSRKQVELSKKPRDTSTPKAFFNAILPEARRSSFHLAYWEDIYNEVVDNQPELTTLEQYLLFKSAKCKKAFKI